MKNNGERAIHGFVQVLVQAHTSVFVRLNSSYFISRRNLCQDKYYGCLYMYIAASNTMGPQAGSFVTQWYKKHAHSIHFYTNARVLMPVVTFYDVKPQSLKIPISAKPSGISPNHTCQCSLVLLSYNISLSHFFTADHL